MKAAIWGFELALLGLVVVGVVGGGIHEASAPQNPLQRRRATSNQLSLNTGTALRILCAGDSITLGTLSSDGNGYREHLRSDLSGLSAHRVVFAGTQTSAHGNMSDGYFAAWPGKTIDYMARHIGPSLAQKPNLVLLHAGTNDMNANSAVATEGNDPTKAATRLARLMDDILQACPDAVLLVAVIINSCASQAQTSATHRFQQLVPGLVQSRLDAGRRVLAANFSDFPTSELHDCVHPTDGGYRMLANWWFDFISQVPRGWIHPPQGPDPERKPSAFLVTTATSLSSPTSTTSASRPSSELSVPFAPSVPPPSNPSSPSSPPSPNHSSSSAALKLGPQSAATMGLITLAALMSVAW